MRVVVVGGGISGLAAAYEATRAGAEVTILEAEDRVGGKLRTESIDGVSMEWGPDSFVASKPAAAELAHELGLELVRPSPAASRAYLLMGGELKPFPSGLVMGVPGGPGAAMRAVRTGIVGAGPALRAALEPLILGGVPDEAVSTVGRRRLGRAWSERLLEPLIEGVYGAPAGDLGAQATLPAFAGARGLTSAARKQPRRAGSPFLSIKGGMARLSAALRDALEDADLRLRTEVVAVERTSDRYVVRTEEGPMDADTVVVTLPAPIACRILEPAAEETARTLGEIRFSSSVVVAMRFAEGSVGRPLDGSGYLVPRSEGLTHAACTWFTTKWPSSGGGEATWLRAIVTSPSVLREGDDDLISARVAGEVAAVIGAKVPPSEVRHHRWEHALPVYAPGHLQKVEQAERALPSGLSLAGASYRGIGVPDCIASGRAAASRVLNNRA